MSTHLIKRVENFDPNPLYFVSGSCRVIVLCQFLPALTPADKNEHGKEVTVSEQYQEKFKAYQI